MTSRMRLLLAPVVLALAVACTQPARDNASVREQREVRPLATSAISAGTLVLPNRLASVKFAVIGDSGRGSQPQYQVAEQMIAFRKQFKYPFVIMLGDNIYEGPATAEDYRTKFEEPYRALLDDGVAFYASLGNHDDPRQVNYEPFHMQGHRYYTFSPPEDPLTRLSTSVRFFAIDTTNLDREQIRWITREVSESRSDWKVCFFHHPLYSGGRYRRSSAAIRWALEPIFVAHGVDAVFAGHEHFYQRSRLQNGILHFVSGGAGSLRPGDATPAPEIERAFDDDYHFMLVEIDREALYFQAISRAGETIDSGALQRGKASTTDAHDAAMSADTPGHR